MFTSDEPTSWGTSAVLKSIWVWEKSQSRVRCIKVKELDSEDIYISKQHKVSNKNRKDRGKQKSDILDRKEKKEYKASFIATWKCSEKIHKIIIFITFQWIWSKSRSVSLRFINDG